MNSEEASPKNRDSQGGARIKQYGTGTALGHRWMVFLARIGLLIGMIGAGYLGTVALMSGPVAGCGPGSGCDRVLSSQWAYWFGLPVGVPAVTIYFCLFAATFTAASRQSPAIRRASAQAIIFISVLVLTAALWFILIQRLVIHAWCGFCMATHASAGLASFFLLLHQWKTRPGAPFPTANKFNRLNARWGVYGATFGLLVLAIGQIAVKVNLYGVTKTSRPVVAVSMQLKLHQGRIVLNPHELPLLGSSEATVFLVSLFDYTCVHCRSQHSLLRAAAEKYSGRLGVITLPTPLDATCNQHITQTAVGNRDACEYAKLSLAVWHAKRESFHEFDHWLLASTLPPPPNQARARAEILVGKETLERALKDPWVTNQLKTNISLYEANGLMIHSGQLPQLIIGNIITHGAIESLEELLGLIERHTKI